MTSAPPRTGVLRRPRLIAALGTVVVATLGVGTWLSASAPSLFASAPAGLEGLSWPAEGEAAVAIGDGPIAVSRDEPVPMASVSKLVTALMVLDERPLQPGEQGGDYWFTREWELAYEDYLARGESALKVPVDGMLTQYQLLQGMLIASACNYADVLVTSIWGDEAAFSAAASLFLAEHGLDGITMVEPTGIDPRNTATPTALIELGRLALDDPVIAEIVATRTADLPGAGPIENTNDLLGDPGVLGIKTGTLEGSNLLSAKEVRDAAGETVRVFAVVLGQPDDEARFTESRRLYTQVEERIASE